MVIEVLEQKYKVGCNRGMGYIEKNYLLTQLNTIIEWSFCTFPKHENEDGEEVEDRKFLGEDPELKPGDVFLFEGQIIAIDSEKRMVLIVSETGRKALDRIWTDVIEPEIEMIFDIDASDDVKW